MHTVLSLLVSGLLAASSLQAAGADDMQILKDAPSLSASEYRVDRMVRVVNHLRSLGKEEAIRILKSYAAQTDVQERGKIFLICRCLFENPQSWKQPRLGAPVPPIKAAVAKQFPVFPLAITNGVPFLLVKGYQLHGIPESVTAFIELCERLPLITRDLPETNLKEAAEQLVNSKAFRELYSEPSDQVEMAKLVARQADLSEPPMAK